MKHNKPLSRAEVEISRFMSLVLRHKPESIGLFLDSQGWAFIDELLARAARINKPISREQLKRIVDDNDKQRFAVSADGLRIRARQGHSTAQVDITFEPVSPPAQLFHGTATRFLDSIRVSGLVPGERQYVHLSPDRTTALAVGNRHGKPVAVTVDAEGMARDGFLFYLSENGVWLTREVPAAYLQI